MLHIEIRVAKPAATAQTPLRSGGQIVGCDIFPTQRLLAYIMRKREKGSKLLPQKQI